jgi:hypothetical protein
MISSIDERFRIQNPAAADRIIATAETYRRQIPVQEAEAFLESANTDLNNFYAKSGFKQRAEARNPEIGHVVREAEALRTQLNEKISSATGKDFGLLKRQYGALSNLEQVTTKRVNVAERQQPNSLAEQIGLAQGLANAAGSLIKGDVGDAVKGGVQIAASHFLKTSNTSDALIENAFNKLRKSAGPFSLTKGFIPKPQLALPAPRGITNSSINVPINQPTRIVGPDSGVTKRIGGAGSRRTIASDLLGSDKISAPTLKRGSYKNIAASKQRTLKRVLNETQTTLGN